jgi:hypothetical protein
MRLTYKRVRADRSGSEPVLQPISETALRLAQAADPADGSGAGPSRDVDGDGLDQRESVELRVLVPAGRAPAPAGLARKLGATCEVLSSSARTPG